jgi:DNA modification methylase
MGEIINDDCLDWMQKQSDNSISCIVTDPPYGLHFMNKGWDKFSKDKLKIGRKELGTHTNSAVHEAARYDERKNDEFQEFMFEFGKEALRIVKPGGHILMFGAPRRYHRQACGLEDAGWEIRDCLMWLFGSGFPKSHNHFGLEGYGTALKPAYEPIIMAMKPLDGTFKQNAEKWGQAGINIDACRIGTEVQPKDLINPIILKMRMELKIGHIIGQGRGMKSKN